MQMMRSVTVAATLLAVANVAEAQRRIVHDGFWIGFGLGGGWLTQQGAADEAVGGGAGYIRLGGTPSERLLLGGEGSAWSQVEGNVTHSRSNSTFTGYFYPTRRGFFAKGGIGLASARLTEQSGNTTITTTESGLGTTIGVGFDIRVARNFFITPNLDLLYQRINDLESSVFLMSIGVIWH